MAASGMRLHASSVHSRRRRGGTRWLLWAAMLPVLAAVLLFGAVRPTVNAGIEIAIFAITGFVLVRSWRHPESLSFHWAMIPMFGFAILILAQWGLRWSIYPAPTLTAFAQICAYGCVFFLGLSAFALGSNFSRAVEVLVEFAAIVSGAAIVQKFTTGNMIYGIRDATMDVLPTGPFTYHNYFAAFIVLLLPLALVTAFARIQHLDWSARLLAILMPAMMLAAFFVAQSRGGAVALAVELLLAAIFLWPQRHHLHKRQRRVAWAVLLLLVFSLLAGWGPIVRRFSSINSDASAADRIQFSLACLEIWRAHPWVGTGLNTFTYVYPQFQRVNNGKVLLHAHDDVAELLADTGSIGFVLALALVIIAALGAARSLRHSSAREFRAYKLAIAIGCIGFAIHCGEDFVSHCPALTYLFWLLLAALLAKTNPLISRSHRQTHALYHPLHDSSRQLAP